MTNATDNSTNATATDTDSTSPDVLALSVLQRVGAGVRERLAATVMNGLRGLLYALDPVGVGRGRA